MASDQSAWQFVGDLQMLAPVMIVLNQESLWYLRENEDKDKENKLG